MLQGAATVSRPTRVEPARDLLARWRADRMAFRNEAILLEDGRPLGAVMEPWQADETSGPWTTRRTAMATSNGLVGTRRRGISGRRP
jgi:hypothetical protein